MLAHLSINNFAIVKSLQLELSKGMTTITGETGAGKSIAIDALGLMSRWSSRSQHGASR